MSSKNYFQLHGCKDRPHPDEVRSYNSTYSDYLEIPSLLALQDSKYKEGINHHEEHLFIVVHQSFELWFKQVLMDLYSVRELMSTGPTPEKEVVILERLSRVEKIINFTLGTFALLETMPPLNFLEYRDYITPASGFQSAQYKELEILLGQRQFTSGHYLNILKECDINGYERVKNALHITSFKDELYKWMERLYEHNKDLMEEFQNKFFRVRQYHLYYVQTVKEAFPFDDMVRNEVPEMMDFVKGNAKSEEELTEEGQSGETPLQSDGEPLKCPMGHSKGNAINTNHHPACMSSTSSNVNGGTNNSTLSPSSESPKSPSLFPDHKSTAGVCPLRTEMIAIEKQMQSTVSFLNGEPLTLQEKRQVEGNFPLDHNDVPTTNREEWKQSCRKRRIAMLFISCYRYTPEIANLAKILDAAIEVEQAFLLWKNRHARMVERMIGHKFGTGGSSGVDYLDSTLRMRIFHDLWHVRSHLVPPTLLPSVDTLNNWKSFNNYFDV